LADNEQPKLLSNDIVDKMDALKREVSYLVTKIKYFRPPTKKTPLKNDEEKKTEKKPSEKTSDVPEADNAGKKETTENNETEANSKADSASESENLFETNENVENQTKSPLEGNFYFLFILSEIQILIIAYFIFKKMKKLRQHQVLSFKFKNFFLLFKYK
jgi:hypothetical protein